MMNEMEHQNNPDIKMKEKPLPVVKVIRKETSGDEQKEVGFQATLDGSVIPTLKGKTLPPTEREVAEVAMFGNSSPETREAANRQRRAINRSYARRSSK